MKEEAPQSAVSTSLCFKARAMKKSNLLMLISKSSLSLLVSVIGSILLTEVTMAQVKPSCFMTDTSGTVIDLSELCNSRSKRSSNIKNTENINNDVNTTINKSAIVNNRARETVNKSAIVNNRARETVRFLGDGSLPFKLGSSASSYYTGTQPVYLRRYQTSQTLGNTEASRNTLLSSGEVLSRDNSDRVFITPGTRVVVPIRTPFIIYRYQK